MEHLLNFVAPASRRLFCLCVVSYAARRSGSPSPRDFAIAAIRCATVCGAGRAGIKRISKTKLNHSSPSATAYETKIAPATATNPIPLSMAMFSV
jgi:hypothetical protein